MVQQIPDQPPGTQFDAVNGDIGQSNRGKCGRCEEQSAKCGDPGGMKGKPLVQEIFEGNDG